MESLIDHKSANLDDYIKNLPDEVLNGDFEEIYKRAPLSTDAICGLGSCRGRNLQRWDFLEIELKYIKFWFSILTVLKVK